MKLITLSIFIAITNISIAQTLKVKDLKRNKIKHSFNVGDVIDIRIDVNDSLPFKFNCSTDNTNEIRINAKIKKIDSSKLTVSNISTSTCYNTKDYTIIKSPLKHEGEYKLDINKINSIVYDTKLSIVGGGIMGIGIVGIIAAPFISFDYNKFKFNKNRSRYAFGIPLVFISVGFTLHSIFKEGPFQLKPFKGAKEWKNYRQGELIVVD